MLDTVALKFGHDQPVWVDWERLFERLGSDEGQIRLRRYGERLREYGAWKVGDLVVMPGRESGIVELRASLPKLLTGQNDAILDVAGVHDGLREIVRRGAEVLEVGLALERARPLRLDYVLHWPVESVAAVLKEIRAALPAPRKHETEWVSSSGALGRSLYYGLKSKHVLRFYDKGAEVAAQELLRVTHGLEPEEFEDLSLEEREQKIRAARREVREEIRREANIDKTLRFEIQDRRPHIIRQIHADGYRAEDVLEQLERPLQKLGEVTITSFDDVYAAEPDWPFRLQASIAHWALAKHPELWPAVRQKCHPNTFYRLRKKARTAVERTWSPEIRPDAFGEHGLSIWDDDELLEAA